MLLFEHQGVWHLMAVFENHSVQVFDFETGMSMFEFHFADRNSEENNLAKDREVVSDST